jgi:hypothetical protein
MLDGPPPGERVSCSGAFARRGVTGEGSLAYFHEFASLDK